MRTSLLALATLFALPLAADCPSCNNRTGSWTTHRAPTDASALPSLIRNGYTEVMAEALYLRPTTCPLDYVIVDPRAIPSTPSEILTWLPEGQKRSLAPDHDWGFRINLGVVCACNDLRVAYSRLHSNQRALTTVPNDCGLWITYAHPRTAQESPLYNPFFNGNPTAGISAAATSSIAFDYDAATLEWGSRTQLKCELALRSAFGLHTTVIDTTIADTWQGTAFQLFPTFLTEEVSNRDHRRTWGIGPYAGLDLHYPLACGFGFEAHLAGAILVGDREENRNGTWLETLIPTEGPPNVQQDQRFSVHHCNHTTLFPYLCARLGLDYIWTCNCCFTVQFAFGYEFHTYINAIEAFRFNDSRGTGQSRCESFDLNGLYLRARLII